MAASGLWIVDGGQCRTRLAYVHTNLQDDKLRRGGGEEEEDRNESTKGSGSEALRLERRLSVWAAVSHI